MTTATADGPATSGSPACARSAAGAPLRVTVVGTGYLGAVSAACLAELGHEVLGVDRDTSRIEALADGRAPFAEPGLTEVLARNVAAGRLRFGTSLAEAATFGEVHLLCVGTPQRPDSGAADLSQLDTVVDALARPCSPGAWSWAGRRSRWAPPSGWPFGWRSLRPVWRRSRGTRGSCAEGHAVLRLVAPGPRGGGRGRLGVGRGDLAPAVRARSRAGGAVHRDGHGHGRARQGAANAYLATKISFINAMAEICEATGADVATLADALGHDPRIGRLFLNAGLGFGGGCLPKDIRAFRIRAGDSGSGRPWTSCVRSMRSTWWRRRRTVDVARALVGGTFGGRPRGCAGRRVQARQRRRARFPCAARRRCHPTRGWAGAGARSGRPGNARAASRPWTTRSTW